MLQAMRSTAASWVVKILFVLLIASFAFWGVNDIFLGQGQNVTVANVGDTDISAQALDGELNRFVQQYQSQGMNRNLAILTGAPQQLLSQMVNGALLEEKLSNLNITVSNRQVKDEIKKNPFFHDSDGNFSPDRFKQVLRSQNMSEEVFVNSIRDDLSKQLFLDLVSRHVKSPDVLNDGMLSYQNEQRKGQFIWFQFSDQQPKDATEEELKAYFDENTQKYQQEELRAVSFINVDLKNAVKPEEITADEVQAAYEDRSDEFTTVAQRKIWQAIISDEAVAKKIVAQSTSLESFNAFLETEKLGNAQDLGWTAEEDLFGDSKAHVFGASNPDKTGILPPLKTAFGWTVFFIEDIKNGGDLKPLAEVETGLREELAADISFERVTDLMRTADESLAAGNSLAQTAETIKAEIITLPTLTRSGKDVDGNDIANLPEDPNFLNDAFSLQQDDLPQLAETDEGGFLITQVTQITPAKTKEYDTIKAQIIENWLQEKRQSLAEQAAEAALKSLKDESKNMQQIAESHDLLLRNYTNLGRAAQSLSGIEGNALVNAVFGLKKGEYSTAQTNEGVALLAYQEKIPFKGTETEEQKGQLSAQLTQQIQNDINQAFLETLRSQISVEVDEDIMNRYFSAASFGQNPGAAYPGTH